MISSVCVKYQASPYAFAKMYLSNRMPYDGRGIIYSGTTLSIAIKATFMTYRKSKCIHKYR